MTHVSKLLLPVAVRRSDKALLEGLDHCAIHHGQAQLTRNLWEAAHPDAPKNVRALALAI